MNEYEADENFDYEIDDNPDVSLPCPSDQHSDDDHSLESRIAWQSPYYGRRAAEKWLLRLYLYRCCRFLRLKLRPEKPTENTSDELPF
jgi:hypothetical protein